MEDSYPLSPLQHGMLFQSLDERQTGVDLVQIACEMHEVLDVACLQRAWRQVVQRHDILRSGFRWDNVDAPRQEVYRHVALPFVHDDWRGCSADEQTARWEDYLRRDRRRGFDLGVPPLMRVALFRTENCHYRLCWTWHHLLLDGRSILLVLDEVFARYEALVRGEELRCEPAPQFREYVEWHRRQDWSAAERFWREALQGFSAPTPLKVAKPSVACDGKQDAWAELEIELSPATTAAVKRLAESAGVTLNTVLQGGWALLLSRYSGERDVVFGEIRACRNSTTPRAHQTVGLFLNTLPVRVRVRNDAPLTRWLQDFRRRWVAVRDHENTPLVTVQGRSDVPRGTRLFDTVVNFQNPSWDAALESRGGPWRNRHFSIRNQPAYRLTLDIYGGRPALQLKLNYDPRHFDEPVIARMLEHYRTLLECMAASPDERLANLSMLSAAERHQVLVEWSGTATDYPRDRCIHELFQEQAQRTPDAVAVVTDEAQLTYGELNQRANRLAWYLRECGVARQTPVGLCVERSAEMVIGMLGILKAGGAYVPLDPANPKERLALMLQDMLRAVDTESSHTKPKRQQGPNNTNPKRQRGPILTFPTPSLAIGDRVDEPSRAHRVSVVIQQHLRDRLPETSAEVICLDGDWPMIGRQSGDDVPTSATAQDVAYVIYTSGSTGQPKGVCVPHRGVVRLLKNTDYIELLPDDCVAQAANVSFDAATFEVWGPLLCGARVVVIARDVVLSPSDFAAAISRHGITAMFLTTALFNQMARESPTAFRGLRHLLFGGEAVDPKWVREVLHNGPPQRLLHVYGPTESTTFATWHAVQEVAADAATIPIGRPISNTRTYVLDRNRHPVPVGVPGELYLGGDGLASYYLNQSELTAEKFVADPFSAEPGARLYRTGDLVRWLPDGNLEFLGRLDRQVKVRGFRIEPDEIESVLGQHPAVREAVVDVREDSAGVRRLAAYLVPKPGADVQQMRAFVSQKLPDYMVPAAFVVLDALPLSPNGKVDRRALPEPEWTRAGREFVAPRNTVEELVAGIWADVFDMDAVSVNDNFFELGGDSLSAAPVLFRVRDVFDAEFPFRLLFENPTVAQLSAAIQLHRQSAAGLPPVVAAPRHEPLPLAYGQQRIWHYSRLLGGVTTNVVPLRFDVTGGLDVPALRDSLSEIVRRHEVLRTNIAVQDGRPVQIVRPAAPVELPVTDLSKHPDACAEADRVSREEARRGFRFEEGPLFRARLLRLNDNEHRLLLTLHHILYDSSSLEIFFRELGVLYEAYGRGAALPLAEPLWQFGDFAVWERQSLRPDRELYQRQLAYWKTQLANPPCRIELPFERPKPTARNLKDSLQRWHLPPDVLREANRLGRREGCTPFMTLLAALKVLLRHDTGAEDIIVGTYRPNRPRPEFEGLLGFFSNFLVLRTNVSGDLTFRQVLGRVRETTLGAYANQDLPFEELTRVLRQEGRQPPPVQVILGVYRPAALVPQLAGLTFHRLDFEAQNIPWELTLAIDEAAGERTCLVAMDTDRFDPLGVLNMTDRYAELLKRIVAAPDSRLFALQMDFRRAA
jgi:amino acid adenylation domain-containing protein